MRPERQRHGLELCGKHHPLGRPQRAAGSRPISL